MRILVTGGAGFVGANLCRGLLAAGQDVVVIDDFSTGFQSNLADLDIDLRTGSILDVHQLRSAARHVDSIVHLAARPSVPRSIENPMLTHDVNVNGTMNVLLAAREVDAHLVFASSSSVYGANEELPKRETMRAVPMSPYAASKLAGESYVLAFRTVYSMGTLAFRFFNIYGRLQATGHAYAAVVPAFVGSLLAGHRLVVYGDGQQCRDFTSVDSVVSVLVDSVVRRVTAEDPVNLAFGTSTSLLELINALEEIACRTAIVEHQPARSGDVRASQADNSKLQRLFPLAEPRSLRDGLKSTVRWFEAGGNLQQR